MKTYPQTAQPQTEATAFQPNGEKGKVRAAIARQLLDAIEQRRVEAMICRAWMKFPRTTV